MASGSSSATRIWLASHELWFPTQSRSTKPATHVFLDGGVAVVGERAFTDLYAAMARDIVRNGGRIACCENFPRIYGTWPKRGAGLPPLDLLHRAMRFLRLGEGAKPAKATRPDIVAQFAAITALQQLRRAQHHTNDWAAAILALDFDYGKLFLSDGNIGYRIEEVIEDARCVQRLMVETGAPTGATRCVISVADANGTLGVHLYFPFSHYFPEECMQMAELAVARLQETRPTHVANGRSWHKIVDVGIYNGSLRGNFVDKAKDCPACGNKTLEKKRCRACATTGHVYPGRRYFPRVVLDEHGRVDTKEARWMKPVADYITNRAAHPQCPAATFFPERETMNSQNEDRLEAVSSMIPVRIATDERCEDYVKALLHMCSLRLVCIKDHTPFFVPFDSPRPSFPRAWIAFFHSVVDAFAESHPTKSIKIESKQEEGPYLPRTQNSENSEGRFAEPANCGFDNESKDANADERVVTDVIPGPWSSPAGPLLSLGDGALRIDDTASQRKRERHLRERYEHLLIAPNDSLEEVQQLSSGIFSEFRRCETVSNDPEGRCRFLGDYIRRFTHPNYQRIQVVRIHHSHSYGNTLVRVRGPGQHFCLISGRSHGDNTIFFMVRRRTAELTQHCFHPQCRGKHHSWGVLPHEDLRLLFQPLEYLKKHKDEMTDIQRSYATKLIETSKALSTKITRSKLRHKSGVPAEHPTPSGRPLAPPLSPTVVHPVVHPVMSKSNARSLGGSGPGGTITYKDVALDDDDDDDGDDKSQRPDLPDIVLQHFAADDDGFHPILPTSLSKKPAPKKTASLTTIEYLPWTEISSLRLLIRTPLHLDLPPPPPPPPPPAHDHPDMQNLDDKEVDVFGRASRRTSLPSVLPLPCAVSTADLLALRDEISHHAHEEKLKKRARAKDEETEQRVSEKRARHE